MHLNKFPEDVLILLASDIPDGKSVCTEMMIREKVNLYLLEKHTDFLGVQGEQ